MSVAHSANLIDCTIEEGLRKNSKIYHANSYTYYRIKELSSSTLLRCQNHQTNDCAATASYFAETRKLKLNRPHNHEPDINEIELTSLKKRLKEESTSSSKPLRQIFDDVCRDTDPSIATQVSFPMVSRGMLARKSERYPNLPHNIGDFICDLAQSESFNKHFKSAIEYQSEEVGALFFSDELIESLPLLTTICMDGTFYIVPSIFNQLFVISVKKGSRYLPTFFCLMKTRLTAHYTALFTKIKELVPCFEPTLVISDFERAPINSLHHIFVEVSTQGCIFHFKQANLRKIGQLHLRNFYLKNRTANQWFNLVFGIGFLPLDRIPGFFEKLCTVEFGNTSQRQKIGQFIAYFQRTWLRDLSMINWHDSSTLTNNFSESFNKKLKSIFAVHHSNVWNFCDKITFIIDDVVLESLRISNNLATTRQRTSQRTLVVPNNLKSQLSIRQIDEIDFLTEHLQITDLVAEIRSAFTGNDESDDELPDLNSEEIADSDHSTDIEFEFSNVNEQAIRFLTNFQSNTELEIRQCVVCFRRRAGSIHYECGHTNVCYRCTRTLVRRAAEEDTVFQCPVCRGLVRTLTSIY